MKIYITGLSSGYDAEHLIRLFYPLAPITAEPPAAEEDALLAGLEGDTLTATLRRNGESVTQTALLSQSETPEKPDRALADLVYSLLRQHTSVRPSWGKLTGVRPVRLIHNALAAGKTMQEVEQYFLGWADCTEEKFAQARSIAQLQAPIMGESRNCKDYSLYIGIPFCPSRCSYCSFVSCNIDGDKKLVQPYVDKLCEEIVAFRQQAEQNNLRLRTIYIGGGTPTSLSAAQLRQLMECVQQNFPLQQLQEYTVEAGRPDCTDAEKLAVIKQYGATRISINPQTFSDEVLRRIGRRHTAQDIVDCYRTARSLGHTDINMDLIAGLPGDTVESFSESVRQVIELDPSNITVHTLALKKAAALYQQRPDLPSGEEVARMLDRTEEQLRAAGYEPYYLYRQKYMSGSFENVGWCKPGYTGLYNIYMMEELHTILSLGGGGMNKVNLGENKLERYHNPKIPQDYIARIDTICRQKDEIFEILNEL